MNSPNPFEPWQDLHATLEQKLQSFDAVDPTAAAITARLKTAQQSMQAGHFARAAANFGHIADLAITANQPEVGAQARYAQAGMLAALPDQQTAAIAAFQKTVDLFADIGNAAMQRQAQRQIQQLQSFPDQGTADVAELSAAIAACTDTTPPQQQIALYGQRGRHYAQSGQYAPAMQDFEVALAIAQRRDDPDLVAFALEQFHDSDSQTDVLTTALQNLTEQVNATADPELQAVFATLQPSLEALLNLPDELLAAIAIAPAASSDPSREAAQSTETLADQLQQLQDSELVKLAAQIQAFQAIESALTAHDHQRALTLADAERRQSLIAQDPQRYLRFGLACHLMAQAYEGLGDRPAVIEVLLYAKTTLEQARGSEMGAPFLKALQALETRWGQEPLMQARRTYRHHMQRQGYYRLDPQT